MRKMIAVLASVLVLGNFATAIAADSELGNKIAQYLCAGNPNIANSYILGADYPIWLEKSMTGTFQDTQGEYSLSLYNYAKNQAQTADAPGTCIRNPGKGYFTKCLKASITVDKNLQKLTRTSYGAFLDKPCSTD